MPSTLTSLGDMKRSFVKTYNPPSYDNPWDLVEDYERVTSYTAAHPQEGSHAVSNVLNLPRSRIRSWVDGDGMPDCYRGLQTALTNGWFPENWQEEEAFALNCLSAWVLSSGSIDKNWRPTFVADSDEEISALRGYATLAGIRLKRTREPERSRPSEWIPADNASILGRVLYTWTGVKGDKTPESVSFPVYLQQSPEHITRNFACIYAQQRGIRRDDREGCIQINADRTDSFRNALKLCLQQVVENDDEIRGDCWPLRIYGDAIDTLRKYPDLRVIT